MLGYVLIYDLNHEHYLSFPAKNSNFTLKIKIDTLFIYNSLSDCRAICLKKLLTMCITTCSKPDRNITRFSMEKWTVQVTNHSNHTGDSNKESKGSYIFVMCSHKTKAKSNCSSSEGKKKKTSIINQVYIVDPF